MNQHVPYIVADPKIGFGVSESTLGVPPWYAGRTHPATRNLSLPYAGRTQPDFTNNCMHAMHAWDPLSTHTIKRYKQ